MKGCTKHINHFSMLLRQLSIEGTGGTCMLFTNAKGGNFFLLNDDLHREQTQTEAEVLLITLLSSLSCTGRRSSSFESIKTHHYCNINEYNDSRDSMGQNINFP